MNQLARSGRFRISHEYETVWLEFENRRPIIIGDFYGDPKLAIIDANEKWCVIGGCGLIVYFLEEPFDEYAYDKVSSQYREFGRKPSIPWYVETIKQISESKIQVALEAGEIHLLEITK